MFHREAVVKRAYVELRERVAKQYEQFPYGRYEWPALLRLADQRSPGFRE